MKKNIYEDEFSQEIINLDDIYNIEAGYTLKSEHSSPVWSLTKRSDANTVELVSGLIYDIDSYKFNPNDIISEHGFFYHKTHSDKYRLLFIFKEAKKLTAEEYKILYVNFMKKCSIDSFEFDERCKNINRWFYCRIKCHPLLKKSGKLITDISPYLTKSDLIKPSDIFSLPDKIEDINVGTRILKRINSFYENFKTKINWKTVLSDKCIMGKLGLHDDNARKDIAFNKPCMSNSFEANIFCHHNTCHARLTENMKLYRDAGDKEIKNYTVLYLAYSIIMGELSIDQVEACGIERKLHPHLKKMFYFKMQPRLDIQMWLKFLHNNIIMYNKYFYDFDGICYVEKDIDELKAYYHYTVGTYISYRTGKDPKNYMMRFLDYLPGECVVNANKIITNEGICLQNGVLFLSENTYQFKNHSEKYFLTELMKFDYDKMAECPTWKRLLIDYFGSDDGLQAQVLQEFFGYCLTYDQKFERCLVLFGEPRAGKNTIAETLLHLVGGVSFSVETLIRPDRRKFLMNKKVAFLNEKINCKVGSIVNDLKRMVSTDDMEVKPLYHEVINVKERPKLILSFNTEATSDLHIDVALKERMIALYFHKTFAGKEDVLLKTKLIEELPGILNWALEGYQRLYTNQAFTTYKNDVEKLYEDSNPLKMDILDFIKSLSSGLYAPSELYDLYITYSGDTRLSVRQFGKIITNFKISKITRKEDNRKVYSIKKVDIQKLIV